MINHDLYGVGGKSPEGNIIDPFDAFDAPRTLFTNRKQTCVVCRED